MARQTYPSEYLRHYKKQLKIEKGLLEAENSLRPKKLRHGEITETKLSPLQ